MAVINILFFIISCLLVFFNKSILNLFDLENDIIEDTTYFLKYYIPLYGLFFMISNFLRGQFKLFFY